MRATQTNTNSTTLLPPVFLILTAYTKLTGGETGTLLPLYYSTRLSLLFVLTITRRQVLLTNAVGYENGKIVDIVCNVDFEE